MTEVVAIPGNADAWRVGDTEFVYEYRRPSTPTRFCIQKDRAIMELYTQLCPGFRGARIIELGIAAGGSTALLALLTAPAKLVACDVIDTPVAALASFLEQNGLTDTVRPYYGVDQGVRRALIDIVDREFGDESIDLVIDDASHVYDKTLASFEVLYPRLRPGGVFVIEDWAAQYYAASHIVAVQADPGSAEYADARAHYEGVVRDGRKPRPPLARIGVELLLAAASSPDVIAQVSVNQHWIEIRRGPADLDPDGFRLSDTYADHFGWLEEEPGQWWLPRLWEGAPSATI